MFGEIYLPFCSVELRVKFECDVHLVEDILRISIVKLGASLFTNVCIKRREFAAWGYISFF